MTRLQSVTAYTVSPKHVSFLLWTPAQRKRASMLYFANVFFILFYLFIMAALFSGPG